MSDHVCNYRSVPPQYIYASTKSHSFDCSAGPWSCTSGSRRCSSSLQHLICWVRGKPIGTAKIATYDLGAVTEFAHCITLSQLQSNKETMAGGAAVTKKSSNKSPQSSSSRCALNVLLKCWEWKHVQPPFHFWSWGKMRPSIVEFAAVVPRLGKVMSTKVSS